MVCRKVPSYQELAFLCLILLLLLQTTCNLFLRGESDLIEQEIFNIYTIFIPLWYYLRTIQFAILALVKFQENTAKQELQTGV